MSELQNANPHMDENGGILFDLNFGGDIHKDLSPATPRANPGLEVVTGRESHAQAY